MDRNLEKLAEENPMAEPMEGGAMVEGFADGSGGTGGPTDRGRARGGRYPGGAERTTVQSDTAGPKVLSGATVLRD